MSSHTPGKWEVRETEPVDTGLDKLVRVKGRNKPIAWAYALGDARLIAAAPEMLRALEAVTGDSEESDYMNQEQIQRLCGKAIRKARGGNE